MSLSEAEVKKISHLAKIAIKDTQTESIVQDLSNILHMVGKISNVNVENIEPMAHPQNKPQRLRMDVLSESIERELLQSIAPQGSIESGFYLVPNVIEIEE